MITVILVAIFISYLTRSLMFDLEFDRESHIMFRKFSPLTLWAFIFMGLLAGLLVSLIIGTFLPMTQVANDPIQLETLNLGSPEIEGHFFLGSGTIDTEEYYLYRYYEGDDRLRDGKIIRYRDDLAIVYLVRDQEANKAFLSTFGYEWKYSWETLIGLIPGKVGAKVYEFHVPVDSIVPEIDIQ